MQLNAPKQVTWLVSVVLIVAGVLGEFVDITFVSANNFWIVTIGAVLLALAAYLKDL